MGTGQAAKCARKRFRRKIRNGDKNLRVIKAHIKLKGHIVEKKVKE